MPECLDISVSVSGAFKTKIVFHVCLSVCAYVINLESSEWIFVTSETVLGNDQLETQLLDFTIRLL